jgi:hypothetical protein
MVSARGLKVGVALALLTVLTTGRLAAQDKGPAPVPPGVPPGGGTILGKRKALEPGPKDDELRKLQIERYNQTLLEMSVLVELALGGKKQPDNLFDAQKRFVEAGLEVFDKSEDRIALLEDYVALAKEAENVFQTQQKAGTTSIADVHVATYHRIDAEIQLLKAKRAAEKKKDK